MILYLLGIVCALAYAITGDAMSLNATAIIVLFSIGEYMVSELKGDDKSCPPHKWTKQSNVLTCVKCKQKPGIEERNE